MGSELVDVLRHLLGDAPRVSPIANMDDWWVRHGRIDERLTTCVARAFAGGFQTDRLGYAFASGYQESCVSLVPALKGVRTSFCVTEQAGNAPSAIETFIERVDDHYVLSGEKSFVSLGTHAEELLVVGHIGLDDHERKRIRVLRIPVDREGISLKTLPELPFAKEIPHASVTFDNVRVSLDEMLEGDGYDDYVKPFRTVEDLHVSAATVGYLLRLGRLSGWGPSDLESLVGFVAAIYPLALVDPMDAAVHVALGGIQRRLSQLIEVLPWQSVEPTARARFETDKKLLTVAASVRRERLRIAWRRLRP